MFHMVTKDSEAKNYMPISHINILLFVPGAGIEPALSLLRTGFSYYYDFRHPLFEVCSLDYTFTMSFNLGAPCLVSTPSNLFS